LTKILDQLKDTFPGLKIRSTFLKTTYKLIPNITWNINSVNRFWEYLNLYWEKLKHSPFF